MIFPHPFVDRCNWPKPLKLPRPGTSNQKQPNQGVVGSPADQSIQAAKDGLPPFGACCHNANFLPFLPDSCDFDMDPVPWGNTLVPGNLRRLAIIEFD